MPHLLFVFALLMAVPALAGEREAGRGPKAGYSVSGPHRLATDCHVQYYRIDGDRTRYRRVHCPGAPSLDSIGMPADGCFNRAVCSRAARRIKVTKDRIILY